MSALFELGAFFDNLLRQGEISQEAYTLHTTHIRQMEALQNGQEQSAGVGIIFTETSPYCVVDIRDDSPASAVVQRGLLRKGDILFSINNTYCNFIIYILPNLAK